MLQASYSQGLSVPPQRLGSTRCVELEHAYTTNHYIKCDDVNATEQAGAGPGPCSTLRQPAGRGRMSGLTVTTGGRKKKPVRWQQMQLQHLQQKVEEKSKLLSALQQENQRLNLRLKVLESVLPVKDYMLSLIKDVTEDQGPQSERQPLHSGLPSTSSLPSDSGSSKVSDELRIDALPLGTEDEDSQKDLTLLLSLASCSNRAAKAALRAPIAVSASSDRYEHERQVMLQATEVWLDMVRHLSLRLMANQAHPEHKWHVDKISEIMYTSFERISKLLICVPYLWYKMMTFNMESLTEEEPAPGHWGQVVSELRLSSEQMKSCKAAMHIFIEQMSAVMKEREQILKSLQDKLHGSPAIPDSGIPAGHMYVELYVLMQALAANVAKERGARDTVIQFIGYGAFDHTTNAALMARSYPYVVDGCAILSEVVRRDEQRLLAPAGPTGRAASGGSIGGGAAVALGGGACDKVLLLLQPAT